MSLKLKFNPELDYQQDAISSMVDLFKGQTPKESNFTVKPTATQVKMGESGVGIGNRLELTNEEILLNLQEVQERNDPSRPPGRGTPPGIGFSLPAVLPQLAPTASRMMARILAPRPPAPVSWPSGPAWAGLAPSRRVRTLKPPRGRRIQGASARK